MDDFVVKGTEGGAVIPVMKRLGLVGMGFGGLNQDEFIHDIPQLMQAQLEQFQFVKKGKTVVDHEGGRIVSLSVFIFSQFYLCFSFQQAANEVRPAALITKDLAARISF